MPGCLSGGGHTGALMRAIDWSTTPLGPIEAWPQSLQTSVSTCLNCSFPILIWWGPDLVKLYNDAYAEILAAKHPWALGAPGRTVWPEIWDTIGPMLDRVMRQGEAVPANDLRLMLNRHGYPEECYFSFSYSPIRDETGQVAGVFCPVIETTQRVFAERRARLLLELEACLRDMPEPYGVKAAAAALLGSHVGASQVGYAEITDDGEHAFIEGEWNDGTMPDAAGLHRLESYGKETISELRAGRTVCVNDVRTDPRTAGPRLADAYAARAIAAFLDVPLVRNGRLTGVMFAHYREPKVWSQNEVLYVREVAERTWSSFERLRAELALRRSEEEFRTLGENLPNLCWVARADGWRYWFNAGFFTYTGRTLAELEGWGWLSVVPQGAARERIQALWARALEGGEGFETVVPLLDSNGRDRPFLTRVVPVHDADGTRVRWFGTNVDISAQQEIEQRLRASEAKLQELNQTLQQQVASRTADRDRIWHLSTDVMLVARFDAAITAVNPAWTTLLGWSEDELLHRSFMELVHPDDRQATLAEVAKLAAGERIPAFVNRYRCKDGSYRVLSWTAVPDETFVHAVGRDITAEKDAAEKLERTQERLRQAQKMEALGQLAGGIAHDFNNILQAVSGGLSLIQRKADDGGAVRKLAAMASDAAARGSAITSRLLAFARADELRAVALRPHALFTAVQEILVHTLGAGVAIEIDVAPDVPGFMADKAQLETVLINLAVNARDAMRDGGVLTLSAATERVADAADHPAGLAAGDYVRLTLADTGSGMDAKTLARAGEPFFTTKPVGRGTGLGLAMARGFAQQSGGGFHIASVVGQGTTVSLWFPTEQGVQATAALAVEGHAAGAGGTGGQVLLVDDDAMVREVLVAHLRDRGYAVAQASDGLAALAGFDFGRRDRRAGDRLFHARYERPGVDRGGPQAPSQDAGRAADRLRRHPVAVGGNRRPLDGRAAQAGLGRRPRRWHRRPAHCPGRRRPVAPGCTRPTLIEGRNGTETPRSRGRL